MWQKHFDDLAETKIEFGLDRISAVYQSINLELNYQPKIITVAGTNAKGSTCAFINSILMSHGVNVGLFTSPHLFVFNERICVGNVNISDDDINKCLTIVEKHRQKTNIKLTFFEVAVLIAWVYFAQQKCEVVVFEVGLGGRLDAVNIWDCNVAVITTIDIDHTNYLGNTRELIALEKIAIARNSKDVVCGDNNPPTTMLEYCRENNIKVKLINRDFGFENKKESRVEHVTFFSGNKNIKKYDIHLTSPLFFIDKQKQNAAVAICAVDSLFNIINKQLGDKKINQALIATKIKARFEIFNVSGVQIIFDICHNPQAAENLAVSLKKLINQSAIDNFNGKVYTVFGILEDKNEQEVVKHLLTLIDFWYLCSTLDNPRGQSADELADKINTLVDDNSNHKKITKFSNPQIALTKALENAKLNDKIIIFGSFVSVAKCYEMLNRIITNSKLRIG